MKTKSALLRSIGVLLALLVFAALPNSVLGELCDPAHDPYCEVVYGHGTTLYLKLITDCPTAATIFYTRTFNTPNTVDPTHSGATPGYLTYSVPNGTLIPIPYGSTIYIRMLAWKLNMGESGIVDCSQSNPNN